MLRKSVFSIPFCIALWLAGTSQAYGQEYPTVRIAQWVWPSLNVLSQGAGLDNEEFSKFGTSAKYTYVESGASLQAAIVANEIDLGLVGGTRFVIMIAAGIPIKLIWFPDAIDSAEGLVVRDSITDITDLEGKKVATPFASMSHYGLLATLDLYGVDASKVEIIDVDAAGCVAAFHRGEVDATFVWDPHFSKINSELGGKRLFTLGDLNRETNGKKGAVDVIFARTDFLEKYPELVEAYVRALHKATKFYHSDQDGAAEAMRSLMGLESVEEVKMQAGGLIFADAEQHLEWGWDDTGVELLVSIGEFLKEQGQLDSSPTKDELTAATDFTFLRKVANE